jgi:RHH-type proline utilization regulon transcriptional repressor/proline dehydrogenase/delta 1-pyrroline-5-carboxylate dehydrogenase
LHPRYEAAQLEALLDELLPRFRELALAAREAGIGLTMDAEEADRLDISLALFARLLDDPALSGWDGLGLAVQAYQKRSMAVLEWLDQRAAAHGRRIPVRLVKGAYWDSEIKLAQERGLPDYPVFTRKINSDVSWLAGARFLLDRRDRFYPQLATHNAHGIAAALAYAGDVQGYEFQRLHGMGAPLYRAVREQAGAALRCRVYAPVGSHRDLLPYLVRRLLENGANTSFVNRIIDEQQPVEAVVRDPVQRVRALDQIANPAIPRPPELFLPERRNSTGLMLSDLAEQQVLARRLSQAEPETREVGALTPLQTTEAGRFEIRMPQDRRHLAGHWSEPGSQEVDAMIALAAEQQPGWDRVPVAERAACLDRAADLIETQRDRFMRLCVEEAGKTLPDALAEVREAADFCRYYAAEARRGLAPRNLPGPTGESNVLQAHGRGVFACISPWNFPLAIFTGQVAAALVAGNSVIAKPAEQTPLIAWHATRCLLEAGVPPGVLQLLPGRGETVGAQICAHPAIAGVAFTGSTETARHINRALAGRDAPIGVLIAETGGQNAMLADSSALPEQVVRDVIASAFGSAGQRCSALRVLLLQEDIADRVIEMLAGAMQRLVIGDPARIRTDVGPVIDEVARDGLQRHIDWLHRNARLIHACRLPASLDHGLFVAPHAFELDRLDQLDREHFGPILHLLRYPADGLDEMVDAVNATGYGLTLGVHSRIERTWLRIQARARAGNCYVNRNMIGAMVGVQPFGGEGLSGTGPKAGGPHYLQRFTTERTLTINTAAIGGNAGLLGAGAE